MNTNCLFCQKKIDQLDINDIELLKKFISSQCKIISPKRTGTCAKHQRRLAKAIKKARHLGLLAYTNR